MDKSTKNVIAVCGAETAKWLLASRDEGSRKFVGIMLIACWLPEDDRHVWLVDADKFDELMKTAEVWGKEEQPG